jgi:heat shock protein HspQ
MNYIWEIIIEGLRQNINEKDICFNVGGKISPYLELIQNVFPEYETDENSERIISKVDVNPHDRFSNIFSEWLETYKPKFFKYYKDYKMESDKDYKHWLDKECDKKFDADDVKEFNKCLVDIIFHFLARVDLKYEMTRKEYYIKFIKNEIENGIFGDSDIFDLFNFEEKRCIAHGVLNLYITNDYMRCAETVLKKIFPYCQVMLRDDNKEIIFYLREPDPKNNKNDKNMEKVDFIIKLFIPLDIKSRVTVHWMHTYGAVSDSETIKLENFII